MATYPIKMLKDEQNIPFVPLVSTEGIQDPEGLTLEQRLLTKLGPANLHGGTNISIRTEGYDCYIDLDLPATLNVIDNLTTSTSGQGALDAHQGYVLKGMIDNLSTVIDDITSTSATNALSANQGRILNNKFNNYALTSTLNNYLLLSGGTLTGQVKSTEQSDEAILISHNAYGIGAGIKCIREDTGTAVSLQVGSGGINHGIYSHALNKWMVYGDASNIYLNGNATSATKATTADYPTGFWGKTTGQSWGTQVGTYLTGWADGQSQGEIAFRKNNPSTGKLSCIVDGYFYQNEGNYRCLDTSDLGNYGFYKWPAGTLTLSSSVPTISKELTITTKGRPVFLMVTGDNNPTTDSCWFNIKFYRDGTLLCHQIDESHASSWNIPFCLSYLDAVGAGSHTYKVEFTIGSGATNLNESGDKQSPNFSIYEI